MKRIFLTAEWRKLIFANYSIDPAILENHIPRGTELDLWNDKCYVSLVGFMFMKTRLLGLRIPYHTDFPEVNLRFYVRYKDGSEWKRGVVFVKEIVPKPALSFVANFLFHERYLTMPMTYEWISDDTGIQVKYQWKKGPAWNILAVKTSSLASPFNAGSKEEFITEHYWGYSSVKGKRTAEYRVEHPSWKLYPVNEFTIACDFKDLYGPEFGTLNTLSPESIFLAEGSGVNVYYKRFL